MAKVLEHQSVDVANLPNCHGVRTFLSPMPQDEAETVQYYRVLRREYGSLWKLGAGGMGVTYKTIDTNLDAPVALKVISAFYTGQRLGAPTLHPQGTRCRQPASAQRRQHPSKR